MFECKNCHNKFKIKYQLHIDAIKDYNYAQLVKNGLLLNPVCPYCGHISALDSPLIYSNTDRKFIIYYIPPSYSEAFDNEVINNPDIINLPGCINGRYTASAELFIETVNSFESIGTDKILTAITNGTLKPHIGLIEIK